MKESSGLKTCRKIVISWQILIAESYDFVFCCFRNCVKISFFRVCDVSCSISKICSTNLNTLQIFCSSESLRVNLKHSTAFFSSSTERRMSDLVIGASLATRVSKQDFFRPNKVVLTLKVLSKNDTQSKFTILLRVQFGIELISKVQSLLDGE